MFAGIREQLSLVNIPKGMRGMSIALVTAGLQAALLLSAAGCRDDDDTSLALNGDTWITSFHIEGYDNFIVEQDNQARSIKVHVEVFNFGKYKGIPVSEVLKKDLALLLSVT